MRTCSQPKSSHYSAFAHFVWRCDFLSWIGLTNGSTTGMPFDVNPCYRLVGFKPKLLQIWYKPHVQGTRESQREGTSLKAVWCEQRRFLQATTCTTAETGQWAPDLYITGFSHQPVLLHLALSLQLRVGHAPGNVSSSIWIENLCYSQIQQKEEYMRVWAGMQWWDCLDSNVCNPAACACPSASITALTQLTPVPLLLSLSQLHKLTLLRVCSYMLGLTLSGCNAGTAADVQMLLWGRYLLAEGSGQPRTETSHIPASGSAKACTPESCTAFFREILLSFSTADSALHAQCFHS